MKANRITGDVRELLPCFRGPQFCVTRGIVVVSASNVPNSEINFRFFFGWLDTKTEGYFRFRHQTARFVDEGTCASVAQSTRGQSFRR